MSSSRSPAGGGPPRLALWMLRQTLPPGTEADTVIGDLFQELHESRDTRAARWRFRLHACSIALRYLPARLGKRHAVHHATHPIERPKMGFDGVAQDLRFAARTLLKHRGFSLVVVATIALGIGAATAIFSVVEAIMIRPLPFAAPDRLVVVNETNNGRMAFAWPNYLDFRARSHSYESLACHQANAFTVLGIGRPRRFEGRLVCWNFFDILGVIPQLGRTFTAADDRAGASAVAMLSNRFWRQDLGADPSVIGRTVRTSERTLTIVGVLPAGFQLSRPEDLFVPLGLTVTPDSGWLDRGNHFGLFAIGRLKPGISLQQARDEAERIAADLRREYPNSNSGNGAEVSPLGERIVEPVESTLTALMGAVGFLLLLACVNVANLLVARGAARRHELAIRSALGGNRWRLVRQLLAESTLLSVAGGVLGLAFAAWLLQVLVALAPEGIPRIQLVEMNRTSLLFALGASIACGLAFGAFPAFQASGWAGQENLARASRTSAAVSPQRTRRTLMVAEVALALVLLTGCGLMAKTMLRLHAVNPGFRPDNLLTARLVLAGEAWNSVERRRALWTALLEKLNAIPGVTSAGLTLSLPIEGSNWGSIFTVRDKPVPPRAELPSAAFVPVSSNYFQATGMRLVKGRDFDARDSVHGARVTIVNEALARRLWPAEDAVGKLLKQGWPETPEQQAPWREVIGVVADVKLDGVDQETPMQAYLPIAQEAMRSAAIVVRTSVQPMSVAGAVEAAVQSLDKDLPLTRVRPMMQVMSNAVARQRLSTVILAIFAALAMLLAAVGLYGVISHSVTERTREIGVRMALGAEGSRVLRIFVLHGLLTAAAGTLIGLVGAAVLARWLEGLLFEVEPTDPMTFGAVALVLLGVALLACYVPARRAARLDPLAALRME